MNAGIFVSFGGALALMAVLLPVRAGQALAKPPATLDFDALDGYLSQAVKEQGRVGISMAIVKDGKIVHAKGYGQRSLEESLSFESDTLFAIGSVTKQFTFTA